MPPIALAVVVLTLSSTSTWPCSADDVFLAKREGKKFSWSTAAPGIDLKPTYLPFEDNITPTYRVIYDGWKRAIAQEEEEVSS